METLYVRVDDRLLHGEVLYGCLPVFQPGHVVVASKLPWVDRVDFTTMPPEIRLSVTDPEGAADLLVPGQRTLVVFGTLADVISAIQAGFRTGSVILANRSRRPATQKLTSSYWVDSEERHLLEGLLRAGILVQAQRVPAGNVISVDEAVLDALARGETGGKV